MPEATTASPDVATSEFNVDVEALNHCLRDIEAFANKVTPALIPLVGFKEGVEKGMSKSRREKERNELIARIPPSLEFVDIFQKYKLALNLVAHLKDYLSNPSAEQLPSILLGPFEQVNKVCLLAHGNVASMVVSPLFTADAKQLMNEGLNVHQLDLIRSLGDAWILDESEWPHSLPVSYIPRFSDGYVPYEDGITAQQLSRRPTIVPSAPSEDSFIRPGLAEVLHGHHEEPPLILIEGANEGTDSAPPSVAPVRPESRHDDTHKDELLEIQKQTLALLREKEQNVEGERKELSMERKRVEDERNQLLHEKVRLEEERSRLSRIEETKKTVTSQENRIEIEHSDNQVLIVDEPVLPPPHVPDPDYESTTKQVSVATSSQVLHDTGDVQRFFINDLITRRAKAAQVTFSLVGQNPRHLSVTTGEFLEVLDDNRNWWRCKNDRNESGYVPYTILSIIKAVPPKQQTAKPDDQQLADLYKQQQLAQLQQQQEKEAQQQELLRQQERERQQEELLKQREKERLQKEMELQEQLQRQQQQQQQQQQEQQEPPQVVVERIIERVPFMYRDDQAAGLPVDQPYYSPYYIDVEDWQKDFDFLDDEGPLSRHRSYSSDYGGRSYSSSPERRSSRRRYRDRSRSSSSSRSPSSDRRHHRSPRRQATRSTGRSRHGDKSGERADAAPIERTPTGRSPGHRTVLREEGIQTDIAAPPGIANSPFVYNEAPAPPPAPALLPQAIQNGTTGLSLEVQQHKYPTPITDDASPVRPASLSVHRRTEAKKQDPFQTELHETLTRTSIKSYERITHQEEEPDENPLNLYGIDADSVLTESSTPSDVRSWLQDRGFSVRTLKLLEDQTGATLFALSKTQLQDFTGREEGSRLYSHLLVSKSKSGYSTTKKRNSELFAILKQRRSRLTTKTSVKTNADQLILPNGSSADQSPLIIETLFDDAIDGESSGQTATTPSGGHTPMSLPAPTTSSAALESTTF